MDDIEYEKATNLELVGFFSTVGGAGCFILGPFFEIWSQNFYITAGVLLVLGIFCWRKGYTSQWL